MIALLLSSCERVMDLGQLKADNMFRMECIAVSNDTTALDLDIVLPLKDYQRQKPNIHQADVRVTIDGREVPVHKATGAEGNLAIGSLYLLEEIPGGAEVAVTATHDEVESMSARVTMPEAFPEYELKVKRITSDSDVYYDEPLYEAELSFIGERDGYFGIELLVDTVEDTSGVFYRHRTYSASLSDSYQDISSTGSVLGENPDWASMNEVELKGHIIYVFHGSESNVFRFRYAHEGEKMEYDFSGGYGYGEDGLYQEEQPVVIHYINKCRFRLYRISQEYYYYSLRDVNSFSSLGLASPSQTYGNISGGIGCLAALSVTELPWQESF